MTTDNLARTINRRLKDFFDIFGGDSLEYRAVYNQVRTALDGAVFRTDGIINGDHAAAPLQISRSKQALNTLQNDQLNDLNERQKRQRTARELRSDRYNELKRVRGTATAGDVKKAANDNFMFNLLREDIYSAAKAKNDSDVIEAYSTYNELAPDERREMERYVLGEYSHIVDNYYNRDHDNDETMFEGDLNDIGI